MAFLEFFPHGSDGNVILDDDEPDELEEMTFLGPFDWERHRKNNRLNDCSDPALDFGEPHPDCDPAQTRAMLEMLFGRGDCDDKRIELARMSKIDKITQAQNWTVAEISAASVSARENNRGDGKTGLGSTYVSAALLMADTPQKRSGDANFAKALFAWVDCDSVESVRLVAEYAARGILVPALAVTTATIPHVRKQFWYRLAVPCEDAGELRRINKALATLFKSDTSVTNPTSLMRLAGVINRPSAAKRAKGRVDEMVTARFNYRAPALDLDQLFRLAEPPEQEQSHGKQEAPHGAGARHDGAGGHQQGSGGDFFRKVNSAALAKLAMWVPKLLPTAKFQPSTGAWRVSSKDLGRALEEDLSISPQGIVDFGVHDMGDNRGGRTAIDLVIEHGNDPDVIAAARWLCEAMGVTAESMGWNGQQGAETPFTRANKAALANPEPWVKALYPNAVHDVSGVWLAGPVSVSAKGVSDSANPGDKSPLDLIKRAKSAARIAQMSLPDAVLWLATCLSGNDVDAGNKLARSWGLGGGEKEEAQDAGAGANGKGAAGAGAKDEDEGWNFKSKAPPDPLDGFVFGGKGPIEPPPALVKKLLPKTGIGFIGGQSKAGKTFIAIHLALCLMTGRPFFGRKINERVGVVILAGEGASSLALRYNVARSQFTELDGGLPIAWLGDVPNMADPQEINKMIVRLKAVDAKFRLDHRMRLGFVIIDTVAATFRITDENSAGEISRITTGLQRATRETGALICPIHHYGKTAESGPRGSSAFLANSDFLLAVLAEIHPQTGAVSNRKLALAKSRDYADGDVWNFELEEMDLGKDEDGEAFGSCYVVEGGVGNARNEKRLSKAATIYMESFQTALLDFGVKIRPFANGSEVEAVDREKVRKEFYRRWPADGDTEKKKADAKRQRFSAGEVDLIARRWLAADDRGNGGIVFVWQVKSC